MDRDFFNDFFYRPTIERTDSRVYTTECRVSIPYRFNEEDSDNFDDFVAPPGHELRIVRTQTELRSALTMTASNIRPRYVVLANNIDITDNWIPINNFRGTLDGNGNSIGTAFNGLQINVTGNTHRDVGLLGRTTGNVTIKNLDVIVASINANLNVAGSTSVGGLIGLVYGGIVEIQDVSVTGGDIQGDFLRAPNMNLTGVGGLVGAVSRGTVRIYRSSVTNSLIRAHTLDGRRIAAGGLIGFLGWAGGCSNTIITIRDSFAGNNQGRIVARSDANRDIPNDNATAGGLIGVQRYAFVNIFNSYVNYSLEYNSVAGNYILSGIGSLNRGNRGYSIGDAARPNCINSGAFLSQSEIRQNNRPMGWDFQDVWRGVSECGYELPIHGVQPVMSPEFVIYFPQGEMPSFEAGGVLPHDLSEVIEIYFTDGFTQHKNVTEYVLTRFNFAQAGEQAVQFFYGSRSFLLYVQVRPWSNTNVRLSRPLATTPGTSRFTATYGLAATEPATLIPPERIGHIFTGYWTHAPAPGVSATRIINPDMRFVPNTEFTDIYGRWIQNTNATVMLHAGWEPISTTLTFTAESARTLSGRVIDVPISISNNPGISVINDLRIDLGDGLSFYFPQGVGAYNANPNTWPFVTRSGSGFTDGMLPMMGRPSGENISESHIVFNFADISTTFDSTENGVLVTLRIKIDDNVAAGSVIPISISPVRARNMAQNEVATTIANGTVTVSDFLFGDVNDDGRVNSFDVQDLVMWINAGRPDGMINAAAGRVSSHFGRPDSFDVQSLVQWVNAGGDPIVGHPGPSMSPFGFMGFAAEDLTIAVGSISAEQNQIIELPIIITGNPGFSVLNDFRIDLGAGLSLYYPQGAAAYSSNPATWPFIARSGSGFWYGIPPIMGRPTDANISSSHIVFNFLDMAEPFTSTEMGTLVTLRLRVDPSASGEIPITLSGGTFDSLPPQGERSAILHSGVVTVGNVITQPCDNTKEELIAELEDLIAFAQNLLLTTAITEYSPNAVGYRAPKAAHTALSNAINAAISVLLSFQSFAEEGSEEYSSEEYSSEEYSSEEYISEEYISEECISEEHISEESSTYECTDEEYPDEDCSEYCLESIITDVLAQLRKIESVFWIKPLNAFNYQG